MIVSISKMTRLRTDMATGERKLILSKVDDDPLIFDAFDLANAQAVSAKLTYPKPQAHKQETYGWAPALFDQGYRVNPYNGRSEFGRWRRGEFCSSEISLMYLDLDNLYDQFQMVTFSYVHETLKELGINHWMYTSFSHTPEKHKVRIVLPTTRELAFEEAFLLFVFFNYLFSYQIDGSIYDAGKFLYGPTYTGDQLFWFDGEDADVDALLWAVGELPEEALEYATKRATKGMAASPLTPQRWAAVQPQLGDPTVGDGVSIYNAKLVNQKWLPDFDAQCSGGSHRQTLFGLMMRVWLKSKGSLTFGEMKQLRDELDRRQFNYSRQKYGVHALDADLRSIMLRAAN